MGELEGKPKRNSGAPIQILKRPSQHYSSRRGSPVKCTIVHYTGGGRVEGTLNWFAMEQSKVSAHIVIARDGRVYRCVPLTKAAWHAGRSESPWGRDVNNHSIGIELANSGPPEEFPEAQLQALEQVLLWLDWLGYHDAAANLLGHDQIAPSRKIDPGPLFPRERFGFKDWEADA